MIDRFKKIIEEYIEYMEKEMSVNQGTLSAYVSDIENYFYDFIEIMGLDIAGDISKTLIIQYLSILKKEGRAVSTISRNLSSLRSFCQFLLNKGYITKDPTVNLKAPKVEKKIPQVLTMEEIEELLKQPDISTLKGARDKAMSELLYSTGIGINEIIALDLDDIDLELEMVTVGKDRTRRTLPIGKYAVKAIKDYLSEYSHKFNSNALFINKSGNRLSRQGFWKGLKEYEEKSGIGKNITARMLRQSFAVHMLENGAEVETVQKMLGHADVTTTNLYLFTSSQKNIREDYKDSHPRA